MNAGPWSRGMIPPDTGDHEFGSRRTHIAVVVQLGERQTEDLDVAGSSRPAFTWLLLLI